jgi:hypothetical protein
MPPATETITAVFNPTPGNTNYSGATSSGVTITVGAAFTLAPTSGAATPINISTPGQSGMEAITLSGAGGFTGTVTLTCSVTPTNLSDPPTCSFNTTSVAFSSATTSGQSILTVHTTAASGLFKPFSRPPSNTPWLLLGEVAAMLAGLFLLEMAGQKRRGIALLVVLVAVVIVAGYGCSSGGGGNSSTGGGSGSNGGTTASSYTVTVTATPTSGSAQQTTIPVSVQ